MPIASPKCTPAIKAYSSYACIRLNFGGKNRPLNQAEIKKSFAVPTYITETMRMLSRFSPFLATRMALYLFFKPLPFPIPGREKELRERSITHRLLTKSGAPFTVFETGTGEEIVLMIHGWSGRGSQFFKLAQKLQNDYRLLLIEAPGHGAHLGKRTHMLAFVEAIEATEQALGKAKFAVGHSLGGMALFNSLEQGSSFQKLVIAGTPANVRNVTNDFCLKVAANERVAEGLLSHIQKRFAVLPEAVSTDFLAPKNTIPWV